MAIFTQSFAIKTHTTNTLKVKQVSDVRIESTPQRSVKSYAVITWNVGVMSDNPNIQLTQLEFKFPVFTKNNLEDINMYFQPGNEFNISIQFDSLNDMENPDHYEIVITHQPKPLFVGANPFLSETEQQNQIKPPRKYWSVTPTNTNLPDMQFAKYIDNQYISLATDPISLINNDNEKLLEISQQISDNNVVIFNQLLAGTNMDNEFGIDWDMRLIGVVADPRVNYKTLTTAATTKLMWNAEYDTSVHKFISLKQL